MKTRLTLCAALLAAGLLLALAGVAHAEGTSLNLWTPEDSLVGGKLYDARLDRPVKFWAPGVTLAEVFEDLRAQTGVTLTFFTPEPDARVRVTLYLNPDHPPALRDLLVQLAWVLDARFIVSRTGESTVYQLLSPSCSTDPLALLAREERQDAQRRHEEEQAKRTADFRQGMARLREVGATLALSREEAIARYRGSDDSLLLALLDPRRRTAAQLLLSLPEETLSEFGQGARLRSSALTEEQKALATQVVGPEEFRSGVTLSGIHCGVFGQGEFWLYWDLSYPGPIVPAGPQAGNTIIALSPVLPRLSDEFALRGLLGETITPEVDAQLRQTYEERSRALHLQDRQRVRAGNAAYTRVTLTPRTSEELSALPLPLDPTRKYALWEVQQAAAKASGRHVVSDYCWQPPRDPRNTFVAETYGTPRSLLDWFTLHAVAHGPRSRWLDPDEGSPWSLGWDWGDAGSFLRFRSRERDLWRASFLPADLLARLDGQLARYLPPPGHPQAWGKTVEIALQLRDYAWAVARARPAEVRLGRHLAYESPADPLAPVKRALRDLVMSGKPEAEWRALAVLTDQQWQALHADGLRADLDLRPEQRTQLRLFPGEDRWNRKDPTGLLLRLTPENPLPGAPRTEAGLPPVTEVTTVFDILTYTRGPKKVASYAFTRAFRLKLQLPPYPYAAKAEQPASGPHSGQ